MSAGLLLDPLFRVPFLVGLILAALLPLLGALLRLRGEWLAALGLAHLAAASALLGLAAGVPAVLGASAGALGGALAKGLGGCRGNTVYALMVLSGWAGTLLVAANTHLGSALGHALVEGQLYFAGPLQLGTALGVASLAALALPWLLPRVVRAALFPHQERANALPAWRWHLGFDLLAALALAVGAGTLGVMGAFALVFLPPWLAFGMAAGWRGALALSAASGALLYVVAFVLALAGDQPFGPVLVGVLLLGAGALRGAVALGRGAGRLR